MCNVSDLLFNLPNVFSITVEFKVSLLGELLVDNRPQNPVVVTVGIFTSASWILKWLETSTGVRDWPAKNNLACLNVCFDHLPENQSQKSNHYKSVRSLPSTRSFKSSRNHLLTENVRREGTRDKSLTTYRIS